MQALDFIYFIIQFILFVVVVILTIVLCANLLWSNKYSFLFIPLFGFPVLHISTGVSILIAAVFVWIS